MIYIDKIASHLKKALLKTKTLSQSYKPQMSGKEQPARFYDQQFLSNELFHVHYTASTYYFIWTVIIDRLRLQEGPKSIIEIGCGSGQLARAIADANIVEEYFGFDFSQERIHYATMKCPEFHFEVSDVFQSDWLQKLQYNVVIMTEFLEHVQEDLRVLAMIKSKTRVIATVPNFSYLSHVRFFQSVQEVYNRYAHSFTELRVDAFFADEASTTFYLMDGIKA